MSGWKGLLAAGAACVALAFGSASQAQEAALGSQLEGLLALARERYPELATMRADADAAAQRVVPAGALSDPKFRTEWRDITRMGEQRPTLAPGRVGSTRYLLMQDLPWAGKRDLKREVAESQAAAASGRVSGTWSELSSRIKATYAQLYYLDQSERLTREILDLMIRLEKVAQVRYASGLAAQQDVVRAQLEQTAMRSELISLDTERRQLLSKMNFLLGRGSAEPLAPPAQVRSLPQLEKLQFTALESRARNRNPLLLASESEIRAAEKGRELAYKGRYPDFSVGVSPIQYGSAVREWELMVEVNIPLQQGSRRAQERESEAMVAAARSRREATANQVLAELYENAAGLESARRTLGLTMDSLLPQSQVTFQSALAGYESGKVDFATVLEAQKQVRQARLNQVKAGLEAQVRLADIERILGEEL